MERKIGGIDKITGDPLMVLSQLLRRPRKVEVQRQQAQLQPTFLPGEAMQDGDLIPTVGVDLVLDLVGSYTTAPGPLPP